MSDAVRDSAFRRSSENHSHGPNDALAERELATPGRSDDTSDRDVVADHVTFSGGDAGTKGTGSSG
jgi:hypothetical protein